MFSNVKRIFALLIGNHLESCREDVKRIKEILKIECHIVMNCNPHEELLKFINRELLESDLLIIYYSGHGKFLGKNINGKMQILSTWLNGDMSKHIFSSDIEIILSNLKCQIFFNFRF